MDGGDRGMAGEPLLEVRWERERGGESCGLVGMDEGWLACATKAPDARASPVTETESPGGSPS